MADSKVEVTGLDDLRRFVGEFPAAVQDTMKATAKAHAFRMAGRAQQILRSKTHGTGRTADSIRVLDESDQHQFRVNVAGDPERPAALPIWLEFGTRFMSARSFIRPTVDELGPAYEADIVNQVEKLTKE